MRPRILVTGARGQVGSALASLLPAHGDVVAVDRAALDLADADAIRSVVREVAPDLVINAAAYTAVDLAEKERDAAFALNARAPEVLAEEAKRRGAVLIHYSTDYVFDGRASEPYAEDAPTAPLNVYGESKLAGEKAIAASGAHALVLRTSWVYGLTGKNFLLTIRRLAAEREELRIVGDQTGTPNWSHALARATCDLVARGLPVLAERAGLYHLTSSGATTWHGFAQAIVGDVARPRVLAIPTSEYPTPARRPAYGALAAGRLAATFGVALPPWQEALASCLAGTVQPPPKGHAEPTPLA